MAGDIRIMEPITDLATTVVSKHNIHKLLKIPDLEVLAVATVPEALLPAAS